MRTLSRKPTSAAATTYCAEVASVIATHAPPVAGQRRHVYLTVGAGSPVHVANAVSVAPTTASPSMVGGDVKAGGASAARAVVDDNGTTAAASKPRSSG